MNATLEKFGYPQGLIFETRHWAAVLRPVQVTLGSVVLINKSAATAFSQLTGEAFEDLGSACKTLEQALGRAFSYDKINYLMLMMVDPHVHFHVFPRYGRALAFDGESFADTAWPGPPDLTRQLAIDDVRFSRILAELRRQSV